MSDPGDTPLLRHAATPITGRYFVRPPRVGPATAWLVGFHGQGQSAEAFLKNLERVPQGGTWLLASVQGLHRYYAGRSQAIVAGWMTSQDRELAIADNVRWVDTALDELEREFGAPQAIVYAGFSQGVAMAYRAGLLGRRRCAAIVAVCGDVPPELKSAPAGDWPRLLAMTGSRDEWYSPARLEADITFLRGVRPDAEAAVFQGGHEWADEVAETVGRWLTRVTTPA